MMERKPIQISSNDVIELQEQVLEQLK